MPDKYPLVTRYFDELDMMGLTPPPRIQALQKAAIELIDRLGVGDFEDKQASMIGAALILYPSSLWANLAQLFEYGPQVESLLQNLMATTPGSFMPPMLAQANAAAGVAVMEDMTRAVKSGGSLPVEGTPPQILDQMKTAYGQDMALFSYLDAPPLLERYETARAGAFGALEKRIRDAQPKKPFKPKGGDFDL
jgi:hypothetical protein